jgi:hypothetical protein
VGDRIPLKPHPQTVSIEPGDMLVMATDGIRHAFMEERILQDAPLDAAERILTRHARGTDDALVLVVRYNGGAP